MLSILIVDDHRIERETVDFLIKRNGLELKTHLARDGVEAIRTVEREKVDILFADIKMPRMNGIELIRRALRINPNLKVIVFSGYAEFEYAKNAIALGVKDYLLKPLVVEDLVNVLKKVMLECEHDLTIAHYSEQKLLLDLMQGKPVTRAVVSQLKRLGIDLETADHSMVLMACNESVFDVEDRRVMSEIEKLGCSDIRYFSMNEWEAVALMGTDHVDGTVQRLYDLFSRDLGKDVFLAVSLPFRGYGAVHRIFRELSEYSDLRFYAKGSSVNRLDRPEPRKFEMGAISQLFMKEIEGSIAGGDWATARRQIDALFEQFGNGTAASVSAIRATCGVILESLDRDDMQWRIEAVKRTQETKSISELYLLLVEGILHKSGTDEAEIREGSRRITKQVRDFVNREYHRPIGVKEIADHVHLAASYLSHIFRRETGIRLAQYIIAVRMAAAEQLVRSTDMRIKEIASRMGYADQSYFGQIFKNTYGVSPARYRQLTE